MSVVIPHRAIDIISKASNPKQAILDTVGDLSHVEVIGDRVLLGIYVRPEKTKGGIIRPDINKQEDVWQGKVGLVLAMGPDAFRDENGELYEQRFEIGDWAVHHIGDARNLHIKDFPCRVIKSGYLIMRVQDPEIIL